MENADIETPALLLDHGKLERNCRLMRERLEAHGVALRPHVKTGKCVEIARIALGAETGPITVSTLREAEYFQGEGFTDILYAVGIVPAKLDRCLALARAGARLTLITDNVPAARAVAEARRASRLPLEVLVEIDSDGHRAGIRPRDALLIEVGRACGEALAGVMTHAGDSYNCRTTEAIRQVAARERDAVVESANALRAAGLRCETVSVGSTPTATFADSFEGVTEVRVGVYVFQDLVIAGLGACAVEDIAISVLASVIGHRGDLNRIITDAGWMALSRDRGTAEHRVDQGYGVVCDEDGTVIPGLIVADANQEHGIVTTRDGSPLDFGRFPVGSRLRILPNHACATAAQHGRYHVLREGRPEALWERISGW